MDILISLYDNLLIYHPNIFFTTLFLIGILGIILTINGIIYLNRELKKIIREIKNDIGKAGTHRKIKIDKDLSFSHLEKFVIRVFMKTFGYILCVIRKILLGINAGFEYLQLRTERVFKKIEKEIFIEE